MKVKKVSTRKITLTYQLIILVCIISVSFTNAELYKNDTSKTPEPRDHHDMTFDTKRKKLVLYGGNGKGDGSVTYHNSIWEWDGRVWKRPSKGSFEQGRSSHVLVYNPQIEKTMLFAGVVPKAYAAPQVKYWDGKKWSDGPNGPSARYSPAVAYDEKRKTMVVFSGSGRGEDIMWEFHNNAWKEIKFSNADKVPSARARAKMAYDHVRETLVLFGGFSNGTSMGDMWEWDGKVWRELKVDGPPARNNHVMVSDKKRKRIVLFGGKIRATNTLFNDTWEWDGEKWEKVSSSGPEPRGVSAAAYDENLEKVVLFGGRDKDRSPLGDFWSWDGRKWGKVNPS